MQLILAQGFKKNQLHIVPIRYRQVLEYGSDTAIIKIRPLLIGMLK